MGQRAPRKERMDTRQDEQDEEDQRFAGFLFLASGFLNEIP